MSTEIVGYDDYAGDDFVGDDIIGADFVGDSDLDRLMAMGADAAPARRRSHANARTVATVKSERGVWREQYLPLNLSGGPTATIAAAATVTVTAQPQKMFRVNRLIISSDVAGGFVINDIRVGVKPQLAGIGSMPGRMFSEQAFGIKLHGDTASISQVVSVIVQNITGGALPFVGAMQGLVVE